MKAHTELNRESGTRKMIMTMAATMLVVLMVLVMMKVIMMMISNKRSYGDGSYCYDETINEDDDDDDDDDNETALKA